MTDEEYYDALFTMFASDGWRLFQEHQQKIFNGLEKSWDALDTVEHFYEAKGRLRELRYMLAFEEEHRMAYDTLRMTDEDI